MTPRLSGRKLADQKATTGVAIWGMFVLMSCSGPLSGEATLRKLIASQDTGVIRLPPGVIVISAELNLCPGAHDLTIQGDGTTLRASDQFHGRAILSGESVKHIRLTGFTVDGDREALARPLAMAPPENEFRIYYPNNGLLFDRAESLEISDVHFTHIVNFAVLISRSSAVRIDQVTVQDSGSLNQLGRNNTTGGIVFEEGSNDFEVRECSFLRVRGNALWTHSMYRSPRLRDGLFAANRFDTVGRDAIQVGHATSIRVQQNRGVNVGFPVEIVDVENGGMPAAIDTSGNVDHTDYSRNSFDETDGKCFDLDGFHDGKVADNRCVNRKRAEDYPFGHFGIVMNNANPDMRPENVEILDNHIDGTKFGGLFLIGSGHRVEGNVFQNLDLAGCNENAKVFGCIFKRDEPEMLEAGIYLGRGAERPATTKDNVIRQNRIAGYRMKSRCIAFAPGVDPQSNVVEGNQCSGEPPR